MKNILLVFRTNIKSSRIPAIVTEIFFVLITFLVSGTFNKTHAHPPVKTLIYEQIYFRFVPHLFFFLSPVFLD